jgi:hypothetical protein
LRKHERRTSMSARRSDTVATEEREGPSSGAEETSTETRSQSAPAATARTVPAKPRQSRSPGLHVCASITL